MKKFLNKIYYYLLFSFVFVFIFSFFVFGLTSNAPLKVNADTINSSDSDFNNYYQLTNDKLTNDSNNIYNSNSKCIATISLNSNTKYDNESNYLFLGRIGLNFDSFSDSEYNSFPAIIGSIPLLMFDFQHIKQNNVGFSISGNLIFHKSFGFGNGIGFFCYLDLDSIRVDVNNDYQNPSDFFINYSADKGDLSFSFDSNFFNTGLGFDHIIYYPRHTYMNVVKEVFRDYLPRELRYITNTESEFNFKCDYDFDYLNSYYGGINYFKYISRLQSSSEQISFNFIRKVNFKNSNGDIICINNLEGATSYAEKSLTTLNANSGLILDSWEYSYTENWWNDTFSKPLFISFLYNSNLSNNFLVTDYSNSDLSKDLYKNDVAWYDIFSHLYNFLIYLIFDMPLISNITKPIYFAIDSFITTLNWTNGIVLGLGIFGAFAMVCLTFAIIKRFL